MLVLARRNKREKLEPNTIVFLVEGDSDKIALELPLSDLIDQKHPEYHVRFLLQERRISQTGDEVDDSDDDSEELIEDDCEVEPGGDITTSSFVTPENIEVKITNRFIMPAVRKEGIYPKRIARIIHIVDLDGAYLPDTSIIPFSFERQANERPFYDGERGVIETSNVPGIIGRNDRKRKNLEYLLRTPLKLSVKTGEFEHRFRRDCASFPL